MDESPQCLSDDSKDYGAMLEEVLDGFFEQNGLGFGSVDIFCLGVSKGNLRLHTIVSTLLCLRDSEGHSPIQQLTILLTEDAVERSGGMAALRPPLERVLAASGCIPALVSISEWLRIIVPSNLWSETLQSIIESVSPLSVVIVADAASFRAEDVGPYAASGGTELPSLPEDLWAPQLHGLARRLTDAVRGRNVYAILDAGRFSPHRSELRDLLKSIDGVGVLGSEIAAAPEAIIASKADEWNRWIVEGHLGAVLKSIAALPALLDAEKPFLRIHVFHRAGLHVQALEEIEAWPINDNPNPFTSVRLARIAADAGAALLAARHLKPAVERLDAYELLESALATAAEIGESGLEERVARRLERLFPGSAVLRRRHVRSLVRAGNYQAAAAAFAKEQDAGEARELYAFLAEALGDVGVPDYLAIRERLAALKPSWAPQANTPLIEDALRRGLVIHALELVLFVEGPGAASRRDIGLVLDIVERLLLERDQHGAFVVDMDRVKTAVIEVVRFLSGHPGDGSLRLRLARLLSVDVTGSLGVPFIASAALDLMRRPVSLRERPRISDSLTPKDLLARRSFIESAFAWLESESVLVLGHSILPASLLSDPPDDLAPAIYEVLRVLSSQITDNSDIKAVMNWLSLGVALAPHTSDPNQDLEMIRLVAGRFALAGRVQQARDLAEQALQSSEPSPRRKRAGWFTMADIYHRLGNHLESLIALACAAAGDPDVDADQAWHETDCLVRLLRDLGLFDLARAAHAAAGHLLHHMPFAGANQHRHLSMGLQIDMAELLRTPERLSTSLPGLITQVAANAGEVLARDGDPAPVAVMLGQLLRLAEENGVPTPAQVSATLEALLERRPSISLLVRTASSTHPRAEDVLSLHKQTEDARYAEHVGYDVRTAALAARRLLGGDEAGRDPETAVLAIELLADRAIATPGWESTAKPPPPLATRGEPAAIAKAISAEGVTLVMAALTADERLVWVAVSAGQLSPVVCEEADVFSAAGLRSWAREFPYRYGVDEITLNLFPLSTEHLRVSALPEGRVLLVIDTELQRLPPNLLRINDEFAGQTRAMAAAPSLSWLAAARSIRAISTGRKAAWISTEETRGHTLAMIADRLSGTFLEHGIGLDTGAALPQGLAGSKLVIVAAHGSIAPEGRFFQHVSNEGDLKLTAAELAGALRNVEVVILFVCSGARADKHPAANTMIGLAKQLLDRGCTAVIASPWPLDARVNYHWLPVFLDKWKGGSSVMDASFQANLAVAKALGADPAKCLAMTVFGDPLRAFDP